MMATYTYSVYDSDPATSDGNVWPDHDNETIEAIDADDASAQVCDILGTCAASCDPADGYQVGDVLHALVWHEDGTVVSHPCHALTAGDLGVSDADAEQTVRQAIRDSIARDEIVHLEHDAAVVNELTALADDSADTAGEHEFWGEDNDGSSWRVHVAREVRP